MKKTFFLCVFFIALFSCSNEELVENETVIDKLTEDKANILSFSNEAEFYNSVETVRRSDNNSIETRSETIESNFHSLFDEYQQALDEADFYYQSEAGYEEFKAKYPSLYFPEYKDDFSVYLPVSDESVSKLLNSEGKVLIAGKEEDFRDVFSYDKIKELGLAIPFIDNPEVEIPVVKESDIPTIEIDYPGSVLRSSFNPQIDTAFTRVDQFTGNMEGTESFPFYNSDKKTKLWVNSYIWESNVHHGLLMIYIDVFFRKKGFLGIWYNGKASSTHWHESLTYYHKNAPSYITITDNLPYIEKNVPAIRPGQPINPFYSKNENSPHKYSNSLGYYPSYCFVGEPFRMVTPWIKGVGYFTHQGFGNTKFGIRFKNKQISPSGRYSPDDPI
jgi:hypothetical protein